MTSLLRAHGLAFENAVLTKPDGVSSAWNSNAIFKVDDPQAFTITIERLERYDGTRSVGVSYLVGVVPADTKMSVTDIEKKHGVFVSPWGNGVVFDTLKLGRVVDTKWPVSEGEKLQDRRLTVTFAENTLYVSMDDQSRFKVVEGIPQGDYRPCISIANPGERLRVVVGSAGKKRLREDLEALHLTRRLWSNRAFTDATVVCSSATGAEKRILVHRCVLAAASPFFEKAFQVEMREAHESSITIRDASENDVEALLQYLYTGDLPEGVQSARLLSLAHRYECDKLVDLCAIDVLASLSEHNCSEYVDIMRPFEEDPRLAQYWAQLADRIGSDPALARALMRGKRLRK